MNTCVKSMILIICIYYIHEHILCVYDDFSYTNGPRRFLIASPVKDSDIPQMKLSQGKLMSLSESRCKVHHSTVVLETTDQARLAETCRCSPIL